jgi:hypothetical protein
MKRGGFLRTEMWRDYLKTALAWWRDKGSANLKAFSPYAWLPILTVASFSLLVSFCNYRLQSNGRPELEFNNGYIDPNSRTLTGFWSNAGKMNAWRVRAKLFAVNDQGTRANQPLAEIEVRGAGGKVFVGKGGQMTYQFQTDQFPGHILVCVTCVDENQKSYEQPFLLVVEKNV